MGARPKSLLAGAFATARRDARPALTADQQADAARLHAALLEAAAGALRGLAETLAATADETIFGATEFVVRDLVLGLGAKAVEAALADRAKKATTGAAAGARPATARPSSSGGSGGPPSPFSARSA